MPKRNKGNNAKRKRDESDSEDEFTHYSPTKKKVQQKRKRQAKKKEEKDESKQLWKTGDEDKTLSEAFEAGPQEAEEEDIFEELEN